MNTDKTIKQAEKLRRVRGLAWMRDGVVLRLATSMLQRATLGRLEVILPSGRSAIFGQTGPLDTGAEARMVFRTFRGVWRVARRGLMGFAESYMDGDVLCDDLAAAFQFYTDNYETLQYQARRLLTARLSDKLAHWRRRNTRKGSRRNIAAHYDLGNAFYELWLDPSMTYSSALYPSGDSANKDLSARDWPNKDLLNKALPNNDGALEQAQEEKYRRLLAALDLSPGRTVLEIGCGWGGMAERLARANAQVTAITISEEQLVHARDRIAAAGLSDKADIRFQDYRDVKGLFDRIVSVEMIEAVGEENWSTYFRMLADRLAAGGAAVLQAITIDEPHFESYRKRPDFIQRYIFPGGMLPTVSRMASEARKAGLSFEAVERFGVSYAATLAEWRTRFLAAWPEIELLGFDARFRRMWEFYLTYCEVGFARGCIDVGIYKLVKAPAGSGSV